MSDIMADSMCQYYIDTLVNCGWTVEEMSVLDELGFQPLDPDAGSIVDLDLLDLSVDIEVTTLGSQLGFGIHDDIKPVEGPSDREVPEIKNETFGKDRGIEATDVGSLLEQFEEKESQICNENSQETVKTKLESNNNMDTKDRNASNNPDSKFLTKEFLERIQRLRAEKKKKSTVMLPMGVPAKRGRGRAMTRGHPVALPASSTPLRLQRVMMQNQDLKGYIPFSEEIVKQTSNNGSEKQSGEITAEKYVEEINVVCDDKVVLGDHDYFRKENTPQGHCQDKNNLDLEEGEVIENEENVEIDISKPVKDKKNKKQKRREENPEVLDENGQYFDKLPSYYTALSIPHKQTRKTASHVTRRGGLSVHDFIERDHSPVREQIDSAYNKIPNYYCSFTNSTRYDSLVIDTTKVNDDGASVKDSSGYSSLSHSVQDSDSSPTRSRSRSCSVSRARSVSCSESRRSSSRHFHRRSRKGNYRRKSSCSPSSVGSSSSSCSRSSCSGCESRSRSRSQSLSRSRSRSHSCSTCSSRSSSSASCSSSRSRERSWQRERRLRKERTHRSRSRGRRRSRRHDSRSSLHSRSRSRDYRCRSRSCTPPEVRERRLSRERRREAKKLEREEEKEKQMRERRIVYVGGIPNNYTRLKLRSAFGRFGEIEHVQLHFREHGDNYGFVTFMYTCDAYAAIEKGKSLPELQGYDLCFGGRRQFCDVEYADLDGNKEVEEEFDTKPRKQDVCDFDELLRQAKAKMRK